MRNPRMRIARNFDFGSGMDMRRSEVTQYSRPGYRGGDDCLRPIRAKGVAGRNLLLLALWLVLASGAALAAEHPVQLPANFDFSKCTECHSDIGKGKVVHTALAMGCDACHVIRNIGIVTVVETKAKGRALCITCHSDKDKAKDGGHLHPPVAGNCTRCHDPHSSPYPFHLKKARSGGKGDNLCLECHNKGVNVPKGGSRHPALDMGCNTCHVTHKTGDPSKLEFAFHLKKAVPALCLECHDAKDPGLIKAHHGQPFATADCTGCHDAHQSSSPYLLNANVHMPFGAGMCDACHQAPKDGKVVLNENGTFALCYTCHDDKKKTIEGSKVQHPAFLLTDRCTTCHNPHASRYRYMLKSRVSICLQCHADRAQQQKTMRFLHQPAFKDGCYICHQPHGSENPTLLRTADVNQLCLTCHGPRAAGKLSEDKQTITIFRGEVTLPAHYLDSVPRIPINMSGRGHPMMNHPTRGVEDPSNPGHKLKCISCHDPHASNESKFMLRVAKGQKILCTKCHQGQGKLKPVSSLAGQSAKTSQGKKKGKKHKKKGGKHKR